MGSVQARILPAIAVYRHTRIFRIDEKRSKLPSAPVRSRRSDVGHPVHERLSGLIELVWYQRCILGPRI